MFQGVLAALTFNSAISFLERGRIPDLRQLSIVELS